MDLQTMSAEDLYGYSGVPVRLEICGNQPPVFGNIYTIDPITRSVILVQFEKTVDHTTPDRLVWIPGSSIKLMHELSDGEVTGSCVPCAEKILDCVDKLVEVKGTTEDDEKTIDDRFGRLLEFLRSKNVPFTEQERTIQIGAVRIVAPYLRENFLSTNVMALQRTQQILAEFLT